MVAAGSISVAGEEHTIRFNQCEDLNNVPFVIVRVRPPTESEASRLPEPCYDTSIRGDGTLAAPSRALAHSSLREIVQIVDDRILTFDPPDVDPSRAFLERGFLPPGTKRYKDKRFMFDRVFSSAAHQGDVYDATARPLLQPLLDGYNATIFAYGVRVSLL
jgi:kinesin family member 18/19